MLRESSVHSDKLHDSSGDQGQVYSNTEINMKNVKFKCYKMDSREDSVPY